MFSAEHQRWPDLENIGVPAGGADQDASLAERVDDPRAFARRGRPDHAAMPEFNADEQARAFFDQYLKGATVHVIEPDRQRNAAVEGATTVPEGALH